MATMDLTAAQLIELAAYVDGSDTPGSQMVRLRTDDDGNLFAAFPPMGEEFSADPSGEAVDRG